MRFAVRVAFVKVEEVFDVHSLVVVHIERKPEIAIWGQGPRAGHVHYGSLRSLSLSGARSLAALATL